MAKSSKPIASTLKIIGEANEIISNYNNQSLEIMNGLTFSQSATIRMIEFYSRSKYLFGNLDELGLEKPFQNILNGICDVENAAVDIDTKDITITADRPQDYDKSFLMTQEIYEWMKESNFGKILNELRDTRTRYGGVIAKKCIYEEDGKKELRIETPQWKNLVTDQVDIESGAIIEKHYMSPAELAKKSDVWDNIKEAMKLATKTRTDRNNVNKQGSVKKVPIFEVRGEFPVAYFKQANGEQFDDDDNYKFSYQYYVIAGQGDMGQILLYKEDNTERVYKYLPRKAKPGRALGVGVVEEGEQAQIWTNDIVQKQHRALEYSSKVIGQSASKKLKGRNLLVEATNGLILEHEPDKPITTVPLIPSGGMQQFDLLLGQWYSQLEKVTSAYAAQRGETPPSGTPFRLQAQVLQQSSSVFDDLKEEFGIFVSEIFYDWILPFQAKKLNTAHILAHEFSADELKGLDKAYSLHAANKTVIDSILSGKLVSAEDYDQLQQGAMDLIQQTKSHRFLDIPKDYYKDLEPKLTITTTGEQRNKAATLESLTNVMLLVAKNPSILQDPVLSQVFSRIIELSGSGISPMSLAAGIQEQAKQIQAQNAGQPNQAPQQPSPAQQQTPQPQQMSLEANPA